MNSINTDKNTGKYRRLLLCGVIAPPALAAFVIITTLITPGYSQVAETVSKLGAQGRPYYYILNTCFIAYGLLITCFACGIYHMPGNNTLEKVISYTMGVHGFFMILTGIFQDDLEGANAVITLEGVLHDLFSVLSFIGLVVVMFLVIRKVYGTSPWGGFTLFTFTVIALNFILSVIFWTEVFSPAEGIIQRIFYGMSLVWIEVFSIRLLGFFKGNRSLGL